jgi:glycosyltransferase involved in cell wall biosynthesis
VRVVAVTAGGVPNPAQSGSALTVWTVVRHLLAGGHEVGVVVPLGKEFDDPGASLEQRVETVRALGAEVTLVRSRAHEVPPSSRFRRLWRPPDEELLPALVDSDAVGEAVEALAPDAVWAYHWDAVAATRGLRGRIPRLATVVDLPQLSALYRWRSTRRRFGRAGLSRLLWLQARLRHLPGLIVALLNECEASADFAAHHAAWLRRHGAAGCEYLRTPIEDLAGAGWREAREAGRSGERPRVLLIGHLRGASTLDGLQLFADTLPELERLLGPDGFEVRIAGGYEAPPHLREALDRPSVRFLGHLEDPGDEFASAAALVVPTSVELGTRVRILSAWSFGCPVVAHAANAAGIPELADGRNVLIASAPDGLARSLAKLLRDEALSRALEEEGRQSYERFFAPSTAAERLVEVLGSLRSTRVAVART